VAGGVEVPFARVVVKEAPEVARVIEVFAHRGTFVLLLSPAYIYQQRMRIEMNPPGFRGRKHAINPGAGPRLQPAAVGTRCTITSLKINEEAISSVVSAIRFPNHNASEII